MALSDYLTGDEWDACLYAMFGQHAADNFGASMRKTITALLDSGYRFAGLDEHGHKRVQVCNGINAPKVMAVARLRKPQKEEIFGWLSNGRKFLQRVLPSLVDETDQEWAEQLAAAEQQAAAEQENPPGGSRRAKQGEE